MASRLHCLVAVHEGKNTVEDSSDEHESTNSEAEFTSKTEVDESEAKASKASSKVSMGWFELRIRENGHAEYASQNVQEVEGGLDNGVGGEGELGNHEREVNLSKDEDGGKEPISRSARNIKRKQVRHQMCVKECD